MYLIGLTGKIGCGKSTVRRMLEKLGARGIDADQIAHAAIERGTPAWNAIVDAFGDAVLRPNGDIDRHALGLRVFGDPEALLRLEQIVHPAVGELVRNLLAENDTPVVVLEAIKLVESGLNQWCDALWVVTCTQDTLLDRVKRDRQMPPEEARARLQAQSAQDDHTRIANIVIDNSRDLDGTFQQVQKAWSDTVHVEQAKDKSSWLLSTTPPPAPPPAPKTEFMPATASPPTPIALIEPPAPISTVGPSQPAPAPVPEPAPIAPKTQALPPSSIVPAAHAPAPTPAAPAAHVPPATKQVQAKERVPAQPIAPVERPSKVPFVQVRRAARSDLDVLRTALAKAEGRSEPFSPNETLKRMGARGYRIALAQSRVVALAAWEAENLVAITRDLWSESADSARLALPPLLTLVEQDANALMCEVSILLVNARSPDYIAEQTNAAGYQVQDLTALHRVWLQVTKERFQEGDRIMVKLLRKSVTTTPVG